MSWHLYRIRFTMLSPLHAGSLPVGNILKTRPYVSGKSLWGAVTAALVEEGLESRDAAGYERIGTAVRDHLRFGFYFPMREGDSSESLVERTGGDLDRFEYEFLDTYSSTAVNNDQGAA